MRGLITILLAGCARKEDAHPRLKIWLAADSAAYMEILEKEKANS